MYRWLAICLALLVFPESSELLKIPALLAHYHQHVTVEKISFVEFLQEHYQENTSDQEHHELPFKDCSHHQHLTYYFTIPFLIIPSSDIDNISEMNTTFYSIEKPITRPSGVWQPPRIV
ncbi:MAG: hypothetical protein U0U66_13870 [Cytophagaceae bacterium]